MGSFSLLVTDSRAFGATDPSVRLSEDSFSALRRRLSVASEAPVAIAELTLRDMRSRSRVDGGPWVCTSCCPCVAALDLTYSCVRSAQVLAPASAEMMEHYSKPFYINLGGPGGRQVLSVVHVEGTT